MKHFIYIIIDDHHISEDILSSLSKNGYNGSVFPSTSLKHTLENNGDIPLFINLSTIEKNKFENNTTITLVVDESQIEEVLNIVKDKTANFTKARGCSFVLPLEKFIGSF